LKPVSLNIHRAYFKWYDPPPTIAFLMPNALVLVHYKYIINTSKPEHESQIL